MRMDIKHLKSTTFLLLMLFSLTLSTPAQTLAASGTGGVKLELKVQDLDENGTEVEYSGNRDLLPNQIVPYLVSVKNLGSDAWVRVQVKFDTLNGDVPVSDSWLNLVGSSNWVKKGNYWYLKVPVRARQEIKFCDAIVVPDLSAVNDTSSFKMAIKAEAIQFENITPDFDSDEPFSGIVIDSSISSGEEGTGTTTFDIRYLNGSDTVVNAESLRGALDDLMPGDERHFNVVIRNNESQNSLVRVNLKEIVQDANDPLLREMKLKILSSGREIYNGSFIDNSLMNGFVISELYQINQDILEFVISLPFDATNAVAFKDIDVDWEFSATRRTINSDDDSSSTYPVRKEEVPKTTPLYIEGEEAYSGGNWIQQAGKWEYKLESGSIVKDGWLYLVNPYSKDEDKSGWFKFNKNGKMETGWIRNNDGNWYFCHNISDGNYGKLETGWHLDSSDGKTYYLDETTGIMATGWKLINNKYYYFATEKDVSGPSWVWKSDLLDSSIGSWVYNALGGRTYGSMYINETTPDGYKVGADGSLIIDETATNVTLPISKITDGYKLDTVKFPTNQITIGGKLTLPIIGKPSINMFIDQG